jgi:hypothetical protein
MDRHTDDRRSNKSGTAGNKKFQETLLKNQLETDLQ